MLGVSGDHFQGCHWHNVFSNSHNSTLDGADQKLLEKVLCPSHILLAGIGLVSSCSTTASFEPKHLFMTSKTVTPWSIISQTLQCEPLLQWNNDLWDNDSKIITSVKYWKTEPLSNCLNFYSHHNQVNCPKGSIFRAWNLSHHNWWQGVHHHLLNGIGQFNPLHSNKHFQHSVQKSLHSFL